MNIFKKCLFFIISLCLLAILVPEKAYSWKPWGKKPQSAIRYRHNVLRSKKYKYIRSHDYNKDGEVDVKDRLIWLNQNRGGSTVFYVSDENSDMVEIMDIDGNGNVEAWEMDQFYNEYDRNGNGILEDYEIENAID